MHALQWHSPPAVDVVAVAAAVLETVVDGEAAGVAVEGLAIAVDVAVLAEVEVVTAADVAEEEVAEARAEEEAERPVQRVEPRSLWNPTGIPVSL